MQPSANNLRARREASNERISPGSNYVGWSVVDEDNIDAGVWQDIMGILAGADNGLFPKAQEMICKRRRHGEFPVLRKTFCGCASSFMMLLRFFEAFYG